jgi:flagella basal body P-ring formation protein FlgA
MHGGAAITDAQEYSSGTHIAANVADLTQQPGMERTMKFRILAYGFATAAAFTATALTAAPVQDHESIRKTAEMFITEGVRSSHGQTPDVRAGKLDSRLRLSHCEEPLEAFQPPGGKMLGNITIGVRCSGTSSWSLYVPVKVSIYDKVVAAARPLTRGEVLQAGDLKLVERDLSQLQSGYFSDPAKVAGMEVTRTVAMDAALSNYLVKEPLQVRRGQRVSLIANSGGLEVRMAGEALADGAAGARIKVRNLSSKRVVDGTVMSATTIQVAM